MLKILYIISYIHPIDQYIYIPAFWNKTRKTTGITLTRNTKRNTCTHTGPEMEPGYGTEVHHTAPTQFSWHTHSVELHYRNYKGIL